MKQFNLLVLISVILLASCKRQVIPATDIDLGKDYFPLTIGHYIEYEVDSILYNAFDRRIDTFQYELRDEIVSEFTDNQGRKSFTVVQYKRPDDIFPWSVNQTYYITETSNNIEVVENNVRIVKMVFPVKVNTRWDGNVYVATQSPELAWYNGWEYKYVNISEPFNTGYKTFDNTVTVNEADYYAGDSTNSEFSVRTFARERYAKNVGLIHREFLSWEFQKVNNNYRTGFIMVYKAKNHN